jgi:hypothetical protein
MESVPQPRSSPEPTDKKVKGKPKRRKANKAERKEAGEALIMELGTLRAVLEESVAQFQLKQCARIAEIVRLLEGDPATGEKPLDLKGRRREAILAVLRQSKLKPHKGRLKDLVAVHDLVDMLDQSLAPLRDHPNR